MLGRNTCTSCRGFVPSVGMGMRVGELARRTGVGVSTLRAWERRFRFLEPQRSPAGHRLYAEADVEQVHAVLRLVGEGLTLAAAVARVASVGIGALPDGEGEALLYGQILHAADQGLWVSKEGRTRYANRHMAEIMRCSIDDLVATPVLEFFEPDDLPRVREQTLNVRSGNRLHFTTTLRRLDGSTFLAEITSTPLFSPAGAYDGAVSLVSDITARDDADTQARLRAALLDSIGEAVTAANPQGQVVYINAAAERLFGWRADEIIGRDGRELLAAPEAAAEAEHIHQGLVDGRRFAGQLRMRRRDGSVFDAHLTCAPALDEHGTVVGLVAVVNDQTERHQRDRTTRKREIQFETLALLGTQALRRRPVDPADPAVPVVTEVVTATRRLLRADRAVVFDLVEGTNELEMRASSPRIDARVVVPSGSGSFAGYVALARKVVLVVNADHDGRFDACSTPALGPSASAIGAPIFGPSGIIGVLVAESSAPNSFDSDDTHLMQGMANIIGTALVREQG